MIPKADPVLLAGDVGGTKTSLGLFEVSGRQLRAETYDSQAFDGIESILHRFLESEQGVRPTAASIAVAGPVADQRVDITNLPWTMDASRIAEALDLPRVHLLNDIEGLAWAIPSLKGDEIHVLRSGVASAGAVRAIVAPGTGLGEGFFVPRGTHIEAFACEGGHTDFAPRTRRQTKLLETLLESFDHVSYERVASGMGIPQLYRFLESEGVRDADKAIEDRIRRADDPTPIIVDAGIRGTCARCSEVLEMFVEILGAEAGNLALKTMATGGVYLGGGIPPRILSLLQHPMFLDAFDAKGRFRHLMRRIPIHVVCRSSASLLGAFRHAASAVEDIPSQ